MSADVVARAARLANDAPAKPLPSPESPTSIFDFTVNGIEEATVPLSRYRGQVTLYVRAAVNCGCGGRTRGSRRCCVPLAPLAACRESVMQSCARVGGMPHALARGRWVNSCKMPRCRLLSTVSHKQGTACVCACAACRSVVNIASF